MNKFKVISFYKFIEIANKEKIKKEIEQFINIKTIRGTILIAEEGINGSISGEEKDLEEIIKFIGEILSIKKLGIKINSVDFLPFNRIKIRLKKEIVSLGKGKFDLKNKCKNFINPTEWNDFINREDVTVIDLRNSYEIGIGRFKNSINPKTKTFREFPKKMKTMKLDKNQKIAIYCTGGIRCEKASYYLNKEGYKHIYQLKGGIINYLDYVNKNCIANEWEGECFVFDNRVTVNKRLQMGKYLQCHGCRNPVSIKETKSKYYIKGVSCPKCYKSRSTSQKNSSISRQKQIEIAEKRKLNHPFKKITNL